MNVAVGPPDYISDGREATNDVAPDGADVTVRRSRCCCCCNKRRVGGGGETRLGSPRTSTHAPAAPFTVSTVVVKNGQATDPKISKRKTDFCNVNSLQGDSEIGLSAGRVFFCIDPVDCVVRLCVLVFYASSPGAVVAS